MPDAHLRVFRGSPGEEGHFDEFDVPVEEGMVVLDALHWIQGHEAPDLAVRWNCKAAKCGSCSAEVDGRPSLTCKTRLSDFDLDETITVEPMRAFPLIRDLVTDVSWNYEVNKTIPPFTPPTTSPQEDWRWQQQDIERVQEYRKCIECFLCQDVCHVLRNHETEQAVHGPALPRPHGRARDAPDRPGRSARYLKDSGGIGFCNITKCCTEVCPEHIKITDNAIIPLKERVADAYYDPIQWFLRKIRGTDADSRASRGAAGLAGRRPGPRGTVRGRTAHPTRPTIGSPVERPVLPRLPTSRVRTDRAPSAAPRVRHPDRRGGTRQPRTGLAGGGAVRPGATGRPRRPGGPGRVDLRLSRGPDQQRRRVHRGRPRPRPRARARCPGGPPPARFEADRRAARRSLAGQGRQADPALDRGARDPRRVRPLVRRPCAAGAELRRRRRWPTRPSTERSRRAGVGGAPPAWLTSRLLTLTTHSRSDSRSPSTQVVALPGHACPPR